MLNFLIYCLLPPFAHSGLDPAAVLFNANESEYCLSSNDANYVQVIHTDIDDGKLAFGIDQPLGHADFYPNGGHLQPGCLNDIKIPLINVNVEVPVGIRTVGNRIGKLIRKSLDYLYSTYKFLVISIYFK